MYHRPTEAKKKERKMTRNPKKNMDARLDELYNIYEDMFHRFLHMHEWSPKQSDNFDADIDKWLGEVAQCRGDMECIIDQIKTKQKRGK
jgi:hypothetical protein